MGLSDSANVSGFLIRESKINHHADFMLEKSQKCYDSSERGTSDGGGDLPNSSLDR